MSRVIRLSASPDLWPNGLVEDLLTAPKVYHSDPAHKSFAVLRQRGVACVDLPDSGLDGEVILVIPDTRASLSELVSIADTLLSPEGCPWDRAQTHQSLKKYLIEEAYELCDAIDTGNQARMLEELGDVLLQPIMHAQMQSLAGGFDIEDVARGICDKLIRRHPHVFGNAIASDPEAVLQNWDSIKKAEHGDVPGSVLDGVPNSMPSLLLALEVSKRAARAGFEWPNVAGVLDKLHEEVDEFAIEVAHQDSDRASEELGDLLFTIVNVARWYKLDPEESLRRMVQRFVKRFSEMERVSKVPLAELSMEQWDALWIRSKSAS